MDWSLRRKLTIIVSCALVALSAMVGTCFYLVLDQNVHRGIGNAHLLVAKTLARAIGIDSGERSNRTVLLLRDTLTTEPSITRIQAVSLDRSTGTLRSVATASSAPARVMTRGDAISQDAARRIRALIASGQDSLTLEHAVGGARSAAIAVIRDSSGVPVGAVILEARNGDTARGSHTLIGASLAVAVGVFVLSFVLALILARIFTNPIHLLIDALQRVGAGDLSVRLSSERNDEFGSLFEGFNDTVERLLRASNMQRVQAERLRNTIYTDELTRLPNRKAFFERTAGLLDGVRHAVLSIDLDNFKMINDHRGHSVGDAVLVEASSRLVEITGNRETVFRLSGDEWAVILVDAVEEAEIGSYAARMIDSLSTPYQIQADEDPVKVSASIGIAVYPHDGETASALIMRADMALAEAKHDGNGYRYFSREVQDRARARLDMIGDLRDAIERNEFYLVYQPIVGEDGGVHGAEALLRWASPERGTVQPGEFIPLLEETGLIIPLGRWIIETACAQSALIRKETPEDFHISVNLSPRQLDDPELSTSIIESLERNDVPYGRLCLEITETLITEYETALPRIRKLHDSGIQVAIDDFGTGYSSLSRISELPIDVLKIDRSFVLQMDPDNPEGSIIAPIVDLARTLNLTVIVEGVETVSQLDALRRLGCNFVQGYVYSRPLPLTEFLTLVEGPRVSAGKVSV